MILLIHGNYIRGLEKEYAKLKSVQDRELLEFELGEISPSEIISSIYTSSFFSSSRRVFIKKIKGNLESVEILLEGLQNTPIPKDTEVIFYEKEKVNPKTKLYKYIQKEGKVVEKSQDKINPSSLIEELLDEKGIKADREVITFLSEAIKNNNLSAENEIEKVILLKYPEKKLGKEDLGDIKEIVSSFDNTVIWDYFNAIERRNKLMAINFLNNLLIKGEAPELILAMIERQVRLYIYSYLELPLDVPPFAQSRIKSAALKFKFDILKQFYVKLADAEYSIKQGLNSPENILFLLTNTFCSI